MCAVPPGSFSCTSVAVAPAWGRVTLGTAETDLGARVTLPTWALATLRSGDGFNCFASRIVDWAILAAFAAARAFLELLLADRWDPALPGTRFGTDYSLHDQSSYASYITVSSCREYTRGFDISPTVRSMR